jgi:hypothetical protein
MIYLAIDKEKMKQNEFSDENSTLSRDHSSKRKSKQTVRLDDDMQIFKYQSVSKSNEVVFFTDSEFKAKIVKERIPTKKLIRKKDTKNSKENYFKIIQIKRHKCANCVFTTDCLSSMTRHRVANIYFLVPKK